MRARPDGERQGLRPASCREIGSSGELRQLAVGTRFLSGVFFLFFHQILNLNF
jgi:hypothetical protein